MVMIMILVVVVAMTFFKMIVIIVIEVITVVLKVVIVIFKALRLVVATTFITAIVVLVFIFIVFVVIVIIAINFMVFAAVIIVTMMSVMTVILAVGFILKSFMPARPMTFTIVPCTRTMACNGIVNFLTHPLPVSRGLRACAMAITPASRCNTSTMASQSILYFVGRMWASWHRAFLVAIKVVTA